MIHRPRTRDELRALTSDCTLEVTRELTRPVFAGVWSMHAELVKRAARDNDAKRAAKAQGA